MKLLPNGVSNRLGRHLLKLEKDSPRILFGVGVVSMVGSTVLACRATLKLEEVLERTNSDLETANTLEHREYSEEDRQKDKVLIYVRAGADVARLYGPSVILGVAGITMLTKSHNILQERNAAITAAYVALDKGFQQYRSRVVDKYGEADDQEFRYGAQKLQIEDPDTGRKKSVVRVADDQPSIYARFFDELSSNWSRDGAEYNMMFLRCQQEYANHLLRARGHVFLNEIYHSLDIPHSKEGAVVGWVLGNGDNFIDFGLYNKDSDAVRDFVNGREGAILLDFNVDGLIYEIIDNQDRAPWQS